MSKAERRAAGVPVSASWSIFNGTFHLIRHFVFFTSKQDEDVDVIRRGLQVLTQIPHADHLEIALNRKSDPASKEIDVVVYGEFADDAALAAYKAHDLYAESISRVKPLREVRLAADYDAADAFTTLASGS